MMKILIRNIRPWDITVSLMRNDVHRTDNRTTLLANFFVFFRSWIWIACPNKKPIRHLLIPISSCWSTKRADYHHAIEFKTVKPRRPPFIFIPLCIQYLLRVQSSDVEAQTRRKLKLLTVTLYFLKWDFRHEKRMKHAVEGVELYVVEK